MGNCLRNGSPSASSNNHHLATRKEANDPGSPTLTYASSTEKPIRWFKKKKKKKQKKAGPGSPTFINASSTDYVTGKSYFSETVSEGNEDTIPGKSYFSETVSDGNEDTIPVVTAVKSHFSETVAQGNEGPNPSDLKAWAEGGSKVFTFAELKAATGNFKKENLLVEGSIQRAYKGWIDERTFAPSKPGSGMVVAVKRFESKGGELESEVSYLGRLSHPNLIKLLGFCLEEEKWLLVYEFMPNGSLKSRLFGRKPGIRSLSWDLRLKIVIGAARGLAFLHTSQVIYGAFTPSTILLDQNYNAKLSDFSLAREGPGEGCTHVSTRLIDSFGYIAPEYIETGHLYVKSDVYGFGVVLLEIMTGLRAIDRKRPRRQHNLVSWLKPILTDNNALKDIMDASMKGQYSSNAMMQVAEITSRCLEQDPSSRPSMDEVVQVLEQLI